MEILLTGGTGYIGARVLAKLVQGGHTVTAVVRSEESQATVETAGATGVVGDLFDATWLAQELARHDGAIHTAAGSDANDADLNAAVIDAAISAYAGTTKPFVHTGGCWTCGSNLEMTEDDPQDPPAITAWRPAGEQRLLASEVKAAVVRPGIVYGYGTGIPSMLAGGPHDDSGALVLIGTGEQHWTTVHVDDLADLYVTVFESSPGGEAYLAISGVNPTVRALGEALGAVVPGSQEEAESRLGGPFSEALLLDQSGTGDKARALGWEPTAPSLVNLLKKGYPADQ